MSIENMTTVSHILLAAAAFFAITAVVMFFTLDISKCWKMVSGKPSAPKKQPRVKQPPKEIVKTVPLSDTATLALSDIGEERTMLLGSDIGEERTMLLGTEDLELIQDIVYMREEGWEQQ